MCSDSMMLRYSSVLNIHVLRVGRNAHSSDNTGRVCNAVKCSATRCPHYSAHDRRRLDGGSTSPYSPRGPRREEAEGGRAGASGPAK